MWVRPGTYPRVGHQKGKGALLGQTPALPTNIRLGWKDFPGTNTLAYYENPLITGLKSFITLVPVPKVTKLFYGRNLEICVIG